jgi:Cu(I)/Ag(I) efflux system membrane protein CusA/SilA
MKASFVLSALMLVAAGANAQGMSMSMPMKPAASSAAKSVMPLVDAEVKKVDAAQGLIVLKHGDLPNLGMPAMTMGFDIADKMLKGIKIGQKVKFQAEMVGGKATVTELKPVRAKKP